MRFLSGALCCLFLTALANAQSSKPFAGEVTASKLKLRAGPGEAYQPVVTLEKGSQVIVLGKHPNDTSWYQIEVPAGYTAWVSGRHVSKTKDGIGQVTTSRLLVRPRPSTTYHHLAGRLNLNEKVTIVEQKSMADGVWYRIRVPRRFPLYASTSYIKNIGPASLIKVEEKAAPAMPATAQTKSDKQFLMIEPAVRKQLAAAKTTDDIKQLKLTIVEVDRSQLSLENRERRVKLLADVLESERKFAIRELQNREDQVQSDLARKLKEIEVRYKERLAAIRKEFEQKKKPRYVTSGIVQWNPDIFGRTPSYRIIEAGKMKFFLIATEFDLGRFVGKRVGVVGITDPESGTGYQTVMVRRIEILGDE